MINVKAVQTTLNIGPQAGKDRFVLQAMTYNTLSEAKVIAEAAARTNMSKQLLRACWESCAEIIKAWATEGHSIPIPGLGHMRFGIRATSVEKVEDVKSNLITSRRVIFVPSVYIKDELAKTSISITCYDKDGKKIKTVTSTDTDDIEVDNGSTETTDSGNGTSTGGNSDSGSNTSDDTGGQQGSYRLAIYKYGSGTMTVTDGNGQVINNNDNVASGSTVNISIVPVAGKVPTAKINGTTDIALTESNGTYVGSFQMPTKGVSLEINSDPGEFAEGE